MIQKKTHVSPEKQTLKPPPPTGDGFADSCFALDFLPSPDDRSGSRMEGLKEVPGLVKQGLLNEAWMILDKHHLEIKDLDFIYAFKALILQKNGQPEAAEKTLLAGLKFGRGKFLLYDRLGFLAFETGQLTEAVRWWIKSIVAMRMLNQVTMWEPFLYLASTARALSGEAQARILTAFVTRLSPHGELSLDDKALKRINEQAQGLPAPSILKALDVLCLHFLQGPDDAPGPSLAGHPHAPADRDPLLPAGSLWGQGIPPWLPRLAVIALCMALILLFFRFLKPSEDTPDMKAPVPPEIRQNSGLVEETKHPLPTPQEPVAGPKAEKEPVVEIEAKKPDRTVTPTETPIPHKEKPSFLKPKIKTVHPDIKKKDEAGTAF